MVVSCSWTWHSSTSSSWLLGWEIYLYFGSSYHFRASIFSFGSMMPNPFNVVDVFKRIHSVNIFYDTLNPSFHICHSWTNSTLMSFSLEPWYPFCVVDGGYINALLWWFASCQHQFIIHEVDLEPFPSIPWGLHTSMASFLALGDGFHLWPSIDRFCVLFKFNSLIHTIQIVLQYLKSH